MSVPSRFYAFDAFSDRIHRDDDRIQSNWVGDLTPADPTITPCVHFVGFRDDAYNRAIRVFGRPHFVHRFWDARAIGDVAPGDTVVFGRDKDWKRFQTDTPTSFSFNDSEHF